MRISEAIRKGCKLMDQSFNGSTHERSCVMQAAADGAGIERQWNETPISELTIMFPILKKVVLAPNTSFIHPYTVRGICIWLNDNCKWTREAIADWLDTLEASDETQRTSL